MTLTAAIAAGYRPIRRAYDHVLMLSPAWQTIKVVMTIDEEVDLSLAIWRAKKWAGNEYGDGYSLHGGDLRPLLASHVLAAGARWVDARA